MTGKGGLFVEGGEAAVIFHCSRCELCISFVGFALATIAASRQKIWRPGHIDLWFSYIGPLVNVLSQGKCLFVPSYLSSGFSAGRCLMLRPLAGQLA